MSAEHGSGSVDLHLHLKAGIDTTEADRRRNRRTIVALLATLIALGAICAAPFIGNYVHRKVSTSAKSQADQSDNRDVIWIARTNGTSVVRHQLVYPATFHERRNPDVVRTQIERVIDVVEKNLGTFEESIEIRIEQTIQRPGQSLGMNTHWTGNLTAAGEGPAIVQLCFDDLGTDEEARFYIALAKLREREDASPSRLVRLGIAHCLRHEDGFDPVSYRLVTTRRPVSTRQELSLEELSHDASYRDRARGSSWAVVYLLSRIEKRPLREIAGFTPKDLPEVWEKLPQIRAAASKR